MQTVKKIRNILAASVMAVLFFTEAAASVPYDSFNYTNRNGYIERVACPAPYLPKEMKAAYNLGVPLSAPEDLFISKNGDFYIADSAENCVYVFDSDWRMRNRIAEFEIEGDASSLKAPEGVFVCGDGEIYVADTGNSRVVVFDGQYKALRQYTAPEIELLGKDYVYKPAKITVAENKGLFVVARDQFNGVMQFDRQGGFLGFLGNNMVAMSPVEKLWRNIMTKEQRAQMTQFIPLEFSNVFMDEDEFLYVVTRASGEAAKVKKLSPDGKNIISQAPALTELTRDAAIMDVCTDENNNYYYIDSQSGRIFVVNPDGNLLYAFGGIGGQVGNFLSPGSINVCKEALYVTDKAQGTITVFTMSDFAKKVTGAGRLYAEGQYDESLALWKDIVNENANFELGYIELGKILYRNEEFEQAMAYFKLGNFRGDTYVNGYSAAFKQQRSLFMRENLPYFLSGLVILAAVASALVVWIRIRRKKKSG